MPSNHLIFCHCLLLLLSVFPSIRVFPVHWLFASESLCWTPEANTTLQINYTSIFFNEFIYFNWRLVTLQYHSGFCHTLTWISHGCICVPHPECPPTFLPIPSLRVIPVHWPMSQKHEQPVSCIKPGLAICFTYGNIHISTLFSLLTPPSPSPTESKSLFFISVSLLLSRI